MLRARKKKTVSCKPNVIPILDAVFIFIFFLLMSAQFLEIHEIGSDAPAVKTISEDNKQDRPPLNLTLRMSKKSISILTGVDGKVLKKISIEKEEGFKNIQNTLFELKKKNPEETSVILKPNKSVDFKLIVKVMDTVREYKKQPVNGVHYAPEEMFNQVIFETIN